MEQICIWLQEFTGQPVTLDYIDYRPGAAGLFPQGQKLLAQRADILGNQWLSLRQSFTLMAAEPGQSDWPDRLTQWVHTHKAPPQLGKNTRWLAQNGRLRQTTAAGTAVYTVDLVAEYEKEKTHED